MSDGHNIRFLRNDNRPDARQELLLRAALLPGPEAGDAWRRWAADADWARLDPSSLQMLPAVYRTLRRLKLRDGPHFARVQGVYRQRWYCNQIVLRGAAGLVSRLAAAGVPVLLLSDAAIALRDRRNLGIRPIDSLAIVVATGDGARALAVLRTAGCHALAVSGPAVMPRFTAFTDENGGRVELHRWVFAEDCVPHAEAEVWRAAKPVEWQQARALLLDPAHQLLHLCVHGARGRAVPALRWISDAATVVLHEGAALDWGLLVATASRCHVSRAALHGLRQLRELLGEAVPDEPLHALAACRAPLRERLEMRVVGRRPIPWLGGFAARGVRWLRISHQQGWLARAAGFPRFLADDFGCGSVRELVSALTSRAVRRISLRFAQLRDRPSS